jgi:type II secretory pathway pseudopilin PulG
MHRQRGFTFLIALFMVATLAMVTLRALEKTATNDRRAKEVELLFVGQAYQRAIMTYYQNSPGTAKAYPPDLRSLLQDNRTTTLQRPLRKLYLDPMTASPNWGIVQAPGGGIMGVYSLSMQQPIKVNGFPPMLSNFIGAKSYQTWQFVYQSI